MAAACSRHARRLRENRHLIFDWDSEAEAEHSEEASVLASPGSSPVGLASEPASYARPVPTSAEQPAGATGSDVESTSVGEASNFDDNGKASILAVDGDVEESSQDDALEPGWVLIDRADAIADSPEPTESKVGRWRASLQTEEGREDRSQRENDVPAVAKVASRPVTTKGSMGPDSKSSKSKGGRRREALAKKQPFALYGRSAPANSIYGYNKRTYNVRAARDVDRNALRHGVRAGVVDPQRSPDRPQRRSIPRQMDRQSLPNPPPAANIRVEDRRALVPRLKLGQGKPDARQDAELKTSRRQRYASKSKTVSVQAQSGPRNECQRPASLRATRSEETASARIAAVLAAESARRRGHFVSEYSARYGGDKGSAPRSYVVDANKPAHGGPSGENRFFDLPTMNRVRYNARGEDAAWR